MHTLAGCTVVKGCGVCGGEAPFGKVVVLAILSVGPV